MPGCGIACRVWREAFKVWHAHATPISQSLGLWAHPLEPLVCMPPLLKQAPFRFSSAALVGR
eukprot:1141935-Pelagomonas_calceolata.AAC.4